MNKRDKEQHLKNYINAARAAGLSRENTRNAVVVQCQMFGLGVRGIRAWSEAVGKKWGEDECDDTN